MRHLSLSESKVRTQLDIIRSLSFKTRQFRHEAIPIAHQETFQWVFEPSNSQAISSDQNDQTSKSKLLNWLEHGTKVFWVSGKPGSGKSTFMKFIANHRKTVEALSRWSHPYRPITSSCYFWHSGSEMQKSLTGLLQTLLYDVFRFCPQLIRQSCPSRWSGEVSNSEKWTEAELRSTLERIAGQVEAPYKFCFFIDGLDEYDGDHIDFCEYLSTIFGQNVKLCVSSRPWNVFNDAFGQDPATRLFVHELTWNDIMSYTQDRLHQHPRWASLESQTNEAGSLIREVATRSEGVFLWVYFVTRLLREGLTNDESIPDLKRRLFSFPTGLEAFFKQMLESISPLHHEKMAGDLLLTMYAPEPLETLVYSFVDDEYEDEDYFERMPVMEEDPEAVYMCQEQTVRRLNERCCGLLEEQLGTVHFLHRTIADFLKTREMSDFLCSRAPKNFKPGVSILKAYAAWLKVSSFYHGQFKLYERETISENDIQQSSLYRGIRTALKYASYLESDVDISKVMIDRLVDDIDSTLGDLAVNIDPLRSVDFPDAHEYVSRLCRILVLRTPLTGYLSRKLSEQPSFLSILDRSPISLVLWPPMASDSSWPVASRQKLDIVLKAGSDPNDSTVWRRFISEILLDNSTPPKRKFQDALDQGLIQLFLDNRADPCVKLPDDKSAFNYFVTRAVFDMDWNENAMDMYLQALSSFIYGGAVLEPYTTPAATGSQETLLDSQLRFLSSGYCNRITLGGLEKKLDWIDKHALEPQRRFIARLIEKIIPCARQAGWPLKHYHDLMDRATSVTKLSSPSTISELSAGCLKRDNETDALEVEEREQKRRAYEGSGESDQNG
ncbi:hypothetical protein FSARC_7847 [Fusarium sarcochroum]|uniref:NACHT domain-containing protein n=1 Tax=Fusarium sarcochroum TaxID=1208366 RepID=A0A8H4TU54_9HYPO|nr:hypothetical protein FSARC_7847 [Fusarium sarcochroum]